MQVQFHRVDFAINPVIEFSAIGGPGVPGGLLRQGASRLCSESKSENPCQNIIRQGDNR